jgi:hypothetical protein
MSGTVMLRALALVILAVAASPARGEDDAMRTIYASVENTLRREYDELLRDILFGKGGAAAKSEQAQHTLKVIYYNKAVMFAMCAGEAERVRSPQAPRVPAQRNLFLTTCVEQKFGELHQFSSALSYAGIFFPDRIERCGDASRLHEQEKLFAPYGFLQLAEPKLYDFSRYNSCMITGKIDGAAISPAAQ